MRRSRAEAEETRARAVRAAARLFRKEGVDAVGLKEIMHEIGLTHGGFYKHFASKDELLAEALAAAGDETRASLGRATASAPPGRRLAALVDDYLSRDHVAHPERGCAVAALAGDVARRSKSARRAITRIIHENIAMLGELLPATRARRRRALAAFATAVGAVVLARATDDAALAGEILDSARAELRGAR
jgi:TetR/AcrR family transcriptional repressor of nem operon